MTPALIARRLERTTPRQRRILLHLMFGRGYKGAQYEMRLTRAIVKNDVHRMAATMGARDITQLAAWVAWLYTCAEARQ